MKPFTRATVALGAGIGLVGAGIAVPAVLSSGVISAQRTGAQVGSAQSTAAPQADQGGVRSVVASPEMLAAMQRDLGLSKTEAVQRVAAEGRAQGVEQQLKGKLGKTFAGAYVDGKAGDLVVAVTDPAAAAAVRAAGATPKIVKTSVGALAKAKSALDAVGASTVAQDVSTWSVDVVANRVTVRAADADAAQALVRAAKVDPALVKIEISAQELRTMADVRGGEAYYIDNRARCSVGFSVVGGFVSAGHCGRPGSVTAGVNRAAQGTFKGSTFPGNDYSHIAVNSSWTPRPWVKDANNGNVIVAGSQEAVVGASVCRSGSTTGWHCGIIKVKDATVRYSQGLVNGLTGTNACAEPGDSGGSFISGQQAQGVTSGGAGNCRSGGVTYFQPVNPILKVYGLQLVTGGGAQQPPAPPTTAPAPTTAPPTTKPPASAQPPTPSPTQTGAPAPKPCTAYPALQRTGKLAAGKAAAVPGTSGFTAPAKRHAGCAAALGNAAVKVMLQRQTNGKWVTVSSKSARGSASVVYAGQAGRYRYVVSLGAAGGTYTFGAKK